MKPKPIDKILQNFPQLNSPKALKKIKKLVSNFKKSILSSMYEAKTHEEQKAALQFMVVHFNMIENGTKIPTLDFVIELIHKDFPHLKDDLDKLLILI